MARKVYSKPVKKLTKKQQLYQQVLKLVDLSVDVEEVVKRFNEFKENQTIIKRLPSDFHRALLEAYSEKITDGYLALKEMPYTVRSYQNDLERRMWTARDELNYCKISRWYIEEPIMYRIIRNNKGRIYNHFMELNPEVKEANEVLRALVIMSKHGVENEYLKNRLYELTDDMSAEKVCRLPLVEKLIEEKELKTSKDRKLIVPILREV